MGARPQERNVSGHLITVRRADDVLPDETRSQVVDAKIERGNPPRHVERQDGRTATGRVHQSRDHSTVQDPRFGIADELVAIRQAQRQLIGAIVVDTKTERLVVRHAEDEPAFDSLLELRASSLCRVRHGGKLYPESVADFKTKCACA